METPNREPQEYSRNLTEYKDPGKYIPIIFLLYSWGSLFGVPIRVSLGCVDIRLRFFHNCILICFGFRVYLDP